jgi:MFS family permease
MPVLVGGRVLQGFGAGMVPAVAYVCVGRGFEEAERPRIFALMSTAWVVPSVVGPAAASVVTDHFGWRWVFGGLIPVTVVAGGLAVPAVAALGRSAEPEDAHEVPGSAGPALVLVLGATALIAGFQQQSPAAVAPLVLVGIAVTALAFRRLTPAGTMRVRAGLPAAVLLRGVLTCAFFATDAFVPLTMTDVRGTGIAYSGVVFAVSAFTWTAASWVQAKVIGRTGPRLLVRTGLVVIGCGVGLMLSVATVAAPTWTAVVAWGLGGFGIGLAYAPLSLVVLARAEPGREGFATAAMQLSDALGVAVGTGLAGAIVATSKRWDLGVDDGVVVVFLGSILVAAVGALLARRIPAATSDRPDATPEAVLGAAALQPEPI